LSAVEIEALGELAETTEDKLRLRFVEEAIRTPLTTRQLRYRAEFAWQAAVGLDARRRGDVERTLGERLAAPDVSFEHKRELALSLWGGGDVGARRGGQAAATFPEAISKPTDSGALSLLAPGRPAGAARLDPQTAKEAAATLTQEMAKTTDPNALQ